MARNNASGDLRIIFQEGELELLSQDRILLESAQHWFDQENVCDEKSVLPDGALLAARKLVKRILDGSTEHDNEKHRITYSA